MDTDTVSDAASVSVVAASADISGVTREMPDLSAYQNLSLIHI